MVSTLSTIEAMPMSRISRFCANTSLASQPSVNGSSSSEPPRSRRTSTASPVQTWARRSSSTAVGSLALRGARILQPDDVAGGIGAHQHRRGAIGEQQHDRHPALEAEQVAPLEPDRLGPQPLVADPAHQRRRRGNRLAFLGPELAPVELDAVVACRRLHRPQPGLAGSSARAEAGCGPGTKAPPPGGLVSITILPERPGDRPPRRPSLYHGTRPRAA